MWRVDRISVDDDDDGAISDGGGGGASVGGGGGGGGVLSAAGAGASSLEAMVAAVAGVERSCSLLVARTRSLSNQIHSGKREQTTSWPITSPPKHIYPSLDPHRLNPLDSHLSR